MELAVTQSTARIRRGGKGMTSTAAVSLDAFILFIVYFFLRYFLSFFPRFLSDVKVYLL